jgi:pimeloyl-ACP methyl ester carboxylesterase
MGRVDSDKPALIYLPGLDGTGRLLYQQASLHAAYKPVCVAYPQDRFTTYEEMAGTAEAALEAACGGRPSAVLAESFGGAVALTLALRRPDLVDRLLLVNTFAHYPHRLRIHLAAELSQLLPARPSPPRSRAFRARFFFSPHVIQGVRDEWWERTSDVPMSGFALRLRLIRHMDLRSRLHGVKCPALVLVAPDDRVVPPVAGRELARLLPCAHLLEMRVGHAAMVHPRVDIAGLLAEPALWKPGRTVVRFGRSRQSVH